LGIPSTSLDFVHLSCVQLPSDKTGAGDYPKDRLDCVAGTVEVGSNWLRAPTVPAVLSEVIIAASGSDEVLDFPAKSDQYSQWRKSEYAKSTLFSREGALFTKKCEQNGAGGRREHAKSLARRGLQ
jgi:hypothetical protein